MKILVADDDLELRGLVAYALRQSGYLVVEAGDGGAALERFSAEEPQAAILDFNMPVRSGIDVVRALRARGARIPVLMLTVRSDEEDLVAALDAGADDYLTKPFSPRTLLARLRALLRRSGGDRPSAIAAGDLVLDAERRAVTVSGGPPVTLTALEFRLLQILLANAGRVVAAERLTAHVWGARGPSERQALKQLVHRLRGKIEDEPAAPRRLTTSPGQGYVLRTEGGALDGPV